jgi:hypothetical protein
MFTAASIGDEELLTGDDRTYYILTHIPQYFKIKGRKSVWRYRVKVRLSFRCSSFWAVGMSEGKNPT